MSDLKPYTGETMPATSITSELGKKSDQESSIHNLLLDYGWAVPVAVGVGYGISKMFGSKPPDEPPPPPPFSTNERKTLRDRFIGQQQTPPGPQTSIEKQLGNLDINTLPKDQREMINTLNDAERKRMARQQAATNAIDEASKGKIPVAENIAPTNTLGSSIKNTAPSVVLAPAPDMVGSLSGISTPEVPTVEDIGKQVATTPLVEPPKKEPKLSPSGAKIGRPTTEEAQAKAAALAAFVPPPGAEKIPENWGKGMGWLVGQFGVNGAQTFIDTYNQGKPFTSDKEFQEKYKKLKETELFGPSFKDVPKEVRKERSITPVAPQFSTKTGYAIPQRIPGGQSGATSLGGLLGMLASGGLMYAGTTPGAQAAMQRAGAAIRDIGISPDLLQGKGEELGRLGTAYVTAGNPQYRQQLLQQLNTETDPNRYNALMVEYQRAGGNVPGGRGAIIPPQ